MESHRSLRLFSFFFFFFFSSLNNGRVLVRQTRRDAYWWKFLLSGEVYKLTRLSHCLLEHDEPKANRYIRLLIFPSFSLSSLLKFHCSLGPLRLKISILSLALSFEACSFMSKSWGSAPDWSDSKVYGVSLIPKSLFYCFCCCFLAICFLCFVSSSSTKPLSQWLSPLTEKLVMG